MEDDTFKRILQDKQSDQSRAEGNNTNVPTLELERQIRCNLYILPSDVEQLQQLYKSR
jgi:hypothetical protein